MRTLAPLLLVLPIALAEPAFAGPGACLRECGATQRGCVEAARARRTAAQPACTGSGAARRQCVAGARSAFTQAAATCKGVARRACRPCCTAGRSRSGCPWNAGVALPAEPQVDGDAVRGRRELLNGDYMTCGVPAKLWNIEGLRGTLSGGFGGGADAPRIPDREGLNAELPFFMNAFTAPDGTRVINANCLMCHGGVFDGQLVIGLGNATADFTRGAGGGSTGVPLDDAVLDLLGLDAGEKSQLRRVVGRGAVLGPLTAMRTIGMNPAEMFAVILMVHHDRDTLAWSDAELTPLVVKDRDGQPLVDARVTSDPPPWWRAHKKHALFYNGMARGDHRGTMALATSVCVDDVARAAQVDEAFKDIQAFIRTVRPPAYARAVDRKLAARGERVFLAACAGCHGTYGARDEDDSYPNLLIPLAVVGTDPVVAEAGIVHAPQLVDWYNRSFYGRITRMVPDDPFPGYMPPPLDGIWATAPYLHNGSVPTVELVLNSRARPAYWKRQDLDSTHFDEQALGWPYVALDTPQASLPETERSLVYDTTYWSQSNAGHTFGDHLSAAERRAVLEYLKTL